MRFHLDPRCPWCWQTSTWVRRLTATGTVEVSWGVFCLELANFSKSIDEFDVDRSVAAPTLRVLVAVRDGEGEDAAGRYYAALGTRYFDAEQALDDPATSRAALADAGLDVTWHDRAIGDPETWRTVVAEHQALVTETRSFGVPTIRLGGGDGPAIFGPVISNPVDSDDEAIELWTHVSWLARYDNFSELKRDRTIEPDLAYWRSFVKKHRS
ncbi:DsbA family protein [Ilumatobacter sp.]|uniref:mycothiol-dependent nitroreductase Rv2466c family protein n=1 Tax=Ilumatobacter sp. TaxID=1967498 RepID=UPI003C67DDF3